MKRARREGGQRLYNVFEAIVFTMANFLNPLNGVIFLVSLKSVNKFIQKGFKVLYKPIYFILWPSFCIPISHVFPWKFIFKFVSIYFIESI